jgi:hypothetical protein
MLRDKGAAPGTGWLNQRYLEITAAFQHQDADFFVVDGEIGTADFNPVAAGQITEGAA